ncbi:MAG: polysaccharide biosynthesis tyrosine autokinase [Anaeroplasma sp.]
MEENNNENNSITLNDIFRVIKKNIILIVSFIFAITLLGGVYVFCFTTPKYSSTSSVVVQVPVSNNSNNSQYDIVTSLRYVETVLDMIPETSILEPVAEKYKDEYGITYSTLCSMISLSHTENSSLIRIKVSSSDPVLSQMIANSIAEQVVLEASEDGVLFFAVGFIKQTGYASKGVYSSPNKKLYIIISFLLGCVVSMAIVFVKEFMSNKFKTKEEIEAMFEEKVIGVFADDKTKKAKKDDRECTCLETNQRNMDSYNRLLNNIKYSNVDNPYKTIMITSTIMEELKSTTIVNLANCIVFNNKKVVVVDLDLHRPTIHKYFNTTNEAGVVDYCDGSMNIDNIIKHTDSGVDIVTSGKRVSNTVSIVGSNKLKTLIDELKEKYDYVLIDTPPTSLCSDSLVISQNVDAVIYNISINQAHKKNIKESINNLKSLKANIIGLNVTKAINYKAEQYYYYNKD